MKLVRPISLVLLCFAFVPSLALGQEKKPGDLIWKFETGEDVISAPALGDNGYIYFGSYDNKVYALNSSNGKKVWDYDTGMPVTSTPAIGADGTVYIGTLNNRFYAFGRKHGNVKWSFKTEGQVRTSPAISEDGYLIFGSSDTHIYCLEPTGELNWKYKTNGMVRSSGVIVGDSVIMSSWDKLVYSFKIKTGEKNWDKEFMGSLMGGISDSISADSSSNLYLNTGKVISLKLNGDIRWWKNAGKGAGNPIFFDSGNTVFSGGHFFHAENGDKIDEIFNPYEGYTPTITSDQTIYLSSHSSTLRALNIKSKKVLWDFKTNGTIEGSPAVDDQGIVYFGSRDNKFYAVQGTAPLANTPWPTFGQNNKRTKVATVDKKEPPTISKHPQSKEVIEGELVSFNIVISGSNPMKVEWFKDGKKIFGPSHSPKYEIVNVQQSHSGTYSALVTNAHGVAFSQSAKLSVSKPAPPEISIHSWSIQNPDTFNFTAKGPNKAAFQLQNHSGEDWVDLMTLNFGDSGELNVSLPIIKTDNTNHRIYRLKLLQ